MSSTSVRAEAIQVQVFSNSSVPEATVSVTALPLSAQQAIASIRLRPNAVAAPARSSQVRPAMVLQERDARRLLEAAERSDVSRGGHFAAGPAGIQVWTGPFDGPNGSHGTAQHLGSVDWSYDTPVRHYATIYRAMVTANGVEEAIYCAGLACFLALTWIAESLGERR